MSVKDHITKKPLFADAAVRFLFVYFAYFITLGNCCILALTCCHGNRAPWSFYFAIFVSERYYKSKIIIYFAYAY